MIKYKAQNICFAIMVLCSTVYCNNTSSMFKQSSKIKIDNNINPITRNEIACLTGFYEGIWKGHTIILEIVDARYNNVLSLKGILSGYIRYNSKVYPVRGVLHLKMIEQKYEVSISMLEYDKNNKICFDFNGSFYCYHDGTGLFDGTIITPGWHHPEMNDITLSKKDSKK